MGRGRSAWRSGDRYRGSQEPSSDGQPLSARARPAAHLCRVVAPSYACLPACSEDELDFGDDEYALTAADRQYEASGTGGRPPQRGTPVPLGRRSPPPGSDPAAQQAGTDVPRGARGNEEA